MRRLLSPHPGLQVLKYHLVYFESQFAFRMDIIHLVTNITVYFNIKGYMALILRFKGNYTLHLPNALNMYNDEVYKSLSVIIHTWA